MWRFVAPKFTGLTQKRATLHKQYWKTVLLDILDPSSEIKNFWTHLHILFVTKEITKNLQSVLLCKCVSYSMKDKISFRNLHPHKGARTAQSAYPKDRRNRVLQNGTDLPDYMVSIPKNSHLSF